MQKKRVKDQAEINHVYIQLPDPMIFQPEILTLPFYFVHETICNHSQL